MTCVPIREAAGWVVTYLFEQWEDNLLSKRDLILPRFSSQECLITDQMALDNLHSHQRQDLAVTDAWHLARIRVEKECSLKQRDIIATVDCAEDVLSSLTQLQARQHGRLSLAWLSKIQPFIEGIRLYDGAMKVYCNSGHGEIALLWGSVNLLIETASRYMACFERLLNVLRTLGENLPRMNDYAKLYSNNDRMQHVLSLLYSDILEFCIFAIKFFSRKGLDIFWRILWSTFELRAGKIVSAINEHKVLIDAEATATGQKEAKVARVEEQVARRIFQEREVIKWLHPADSQNHLERVSHSKRPGTGEWFLNAQSTSDWLQDRSKVFWLYGIPGCGKSVLFSGLVEHLIGERIKGWSTEKRFAFFFCDGTSAAKRSSVAVLRSLIAQLIAENIELVDIAFDAMVKSGQERATSLGGLLHLLKRIIAKNPQCKTFVMIDAWDECEDAQENNLMDELLAIATAEENSMVLMVASRNEPPIREKLQTFPALEVNAELIRQDLELYIKHAIESPPLSKLNDTTIKKKILRLLSSRANGQFLWVKLMVINLTKCTFLWEFEEVLENLPLGLEKIYSRVLERLLLEPKRRQEAAIKLFQWLVCAERPLSTSELRAALSIQEGDTELDWKSQPLDLKSFLEDTCGALIKIDDAEANGCLLGHVDFVHITVKEYFLSSDELWASSKPDISKFRINTVIANAYLASTCITCLNFEIFTTSSIAALQEESTELQEGHSLLEYASTFWATHLAQSGPPTVEMLRKLEAFLKSDQLSAYLERAAEAKASVSNLLVLQGQLNAWVSQLSTGNPRVKLVVNCFRTHYERSARMREENLGPLHHETLESLYQLAGILHFGGDWKGAELYYRKVLDGRLQTIGEENPKSLETMYQLATVSRRLGKHEDAQALHIRALDGQRKVLGKTHTQTLASEDGLASTLCELRLLTEAEAMSRSTLIRKNRVFGVSHLRTVDTANILAATLKDIGNAHSRSGDHALATEAWVECESICLRCLPVRENSLGSDHPETLTVINMLGIVLRQLGRPEESEAHHRRAFLARQKHFGPNSPHTQRSMRNLIATLKDQCKTAEVAEMEARLEKSLEQNPTLRERDLQMLRLNPALKQEIGAGGIINL